MRLTTINASTYFLSWGWWELTPNPLPLLQSRTGLQSLLTLYVRGSYDNTYIQIVLLHPWSFSQVVSKDKSNLNLLPQRGSDLNPRCEQTKARSNGFGLSSFVLLGGACMHLSDVYRGPDALGGVPRVFDPEGGPRFKATHSPPLD
jgi:hypothetical protein